jgi:hypothetical protein
MPIRITKIRIFVASPQDVAYERNRLKNVIDELNTFVADDKDFILELVRWETHCVPDMGETQGVINKQIGDYDIFVGIMWKRFGTPTKKANSGTEEEFLKAYESWKTDEKPLRILFYFCQKPYVLNTIQEVDQLKKVIEFKSKLQQKGLIFTYPGPKGFADKVRPHLTKTILDLAKTKKTKRKDTFKITSPRKDFVSEKYVKITGTGAKPGDSVILISLINNKFFKPYKNVVTSHKDGKWIYENCQLYNVRSERLIYALSVNSNDVKKVQSIFNTGGKSLTIHDLESKLSDKNIIYQLSKGKRLIRIEK